MTGERPDRGVAPQALEHFAARVGGGHAPGWQRELLADLDAAAAEVFAAFSIAGVDALLLKGPALATTLYRAGEQRTYSDVDVLVAPRHLPRARQVLIELEYTNARERSGIDDVGRVVHEESWLGRGPRADSRGAPAWERTVVIELHLWLPGATSEPQGVWRVLATHQTDIELAGSRVPILDNAGLALHLATHAAQHGAGIPKGLRELELGLERWPRHVWMGAVRLAAAIGATEWMAAGLRLVPAGQALAQDLRLPRNERLEWEIEHAGSRPRGTFHMQALSETQGALERVRVIRRALLPSPKWLVSQHVWARGSASRIAAAYAVHLLCAPLWALRAWHFRRRARRARSSP